MKTFSFIDSVSEVLINESLTAFFTLKGSEEFLKDHFAGFPVMPGVLLLESMKQAAVRLLSESSPDARAHFRLTKVDAVKFGQFVKPGQKIRIFVRRLSEKQGAEPGMIFEGRIDLVSDQALTGKAISARFSLEHVG